MMDNGEIACWGQNNYGQLGDGTTTGRGEPTQTASLGPGRHAVAISSGKEHACAILDDGSVVCWGRNNIGQLGDGTTIDRSVPTQTSSLGVGRTAVSIAAGTTHTCAILDDGSVSCWGVGSGIGNGINFESFVPTQTSSLGTNRSAIAISSGEGFSCALLDDGSVACWGSRQLGQGTTDHSYVPTQTSSLGQGRYAVAISSGTSHTCAIGQRFIGLLGLTTGVNGTGLP